MDNKLDMLSSLTLTTFVANKTINAVELNTIVRVFKEAIEVLRDRVDYIRLFDDGVKYANEGDIIDDINATYKVLNFIRDSNKKLDNLETDFTTYVNTTNGLIGNFSLITIPSVTTLIGALNSLHTKINTNLSSISRLNSLLDGITVGVIEDLKNDIDIIQQTYPNNTYLGLLMTDIAGAGRTNESIKGNAIAIAEMVIDVAAIQGAIPYKADLVNGTVPMDQLPALVRNSNKGRFATLYALQTAWPYGSPDLQSGDFAVVGTVGSASEFYSYDSVDERWESSGFSGVVNTVNNIDADANGNISITSDDIDTSNSINKFVTQTEKNKLGDVLISNNQSVTNIVVLTQLEYDNIINKGGSTLYFIKETI